MSKTITKLSPTARAYVGGVIAAGFVALIHSAVTLSSSQPPREWLILAALTLLTGSLTLKGPAISARHFRLRDIRFTSVLWFGTKVATYHSCARRPRRDFVASAEIIDRAFESLFNVVGAVIPPFGSLRPPV